MIQSMFHNKSKHTKHVKFSKKVRFTLDTQKEYLNREWPLELYVKSLKDGWTLGFDPS